MDPILYWNDVALEANRVSHSNGKMEQTGPTLSSRALAIVHLAMYDAYAGVIAKPGKLPHYLQNLGMPKPGASAAAAVAAAAHSTLSALFPSQKSFFDLKHRQAGLSGGGLQKGHAFGLEVAAAMLKDREDDPNAGDKGYVPSLDRGAHRPDPDNPGQGFHGPFYGTARCFAVTQRHGLEPPPQPVQGDNEYRKALDEVRAKGIAPELMGTLPSGADPRTADEYLIGIYWGYDGANGLGTPPRLYNQIIREVAIARKIKPDENARLFAFVNAAMADAGILAWEQKYLHDFWRPVIGIREDDPSMGPAAEEGKDKIRSTCDPGWLPLGAPSTNANEGAAQSKHAYPCQTVRTETVKNFTPPFPAYPSGHATFGAAAFQVARLFFKVPADAHQDDLFKGLTFVSDEFNGANKDNKGTVRPRHVRSFPRGLWQMIEENGYSRVVLGVHWIFDAFLRKADGSPDLDKNVGGVPLGLAIAKDIFQAGGGEAPKRSNV